MSTVFWIFEAAFRSILMAAVVWGGIRLLRVKAMQAEKLAWALVLLAAGAMPVAMHNSWLAKGLPGLQPVRIPLRPVTLQPAAPRPTLQPAIVAAVAEPLRIPPPSKPSAAHGIGEESNLSAVPSESDFARFRATEAPATTQDYIRPANVAQPTRRFLWDWPLFRSIGLTLYGCVAGVLLLRMFLGLTIALRLWCRAVPAEDLGCLGAVRVSSDLATPVTIGSTVILPAAFQDWDPAKLRMVLAHERAHIRQRDFYLQILAALHAAAFWFSPLGWWLQRKLSELGEALSDRAGLAASTSPAAYAQILLEFASQPRTSILSGFFAGPLTGVPMARTSNLSSRIERILNPSRFRLADPASRRHAALTAALVPAALVAVVACIRIVPAVEAEQTENPAQRSALTSIQTVSTGETGNVTVVPQQVSTVNFATPTALLARFAAVDFNQPAPQAPAAPPAPVAPNSPPPPAEASESTDAADALEQTQVLKEIEESDSSNAYSYSNVGNDGEGDFAIVSGKDGDSVNVYGNGQDELKKVREKYHDFIWFRRGGKSYVITDPAIVARSAKMFKQDPALEVRQAQLAKMQADLQVQMEKLEPLKLEAPLNSPEFKEQMAKLNAELADLQKVKIKEITDKVNAEVLAELQEKMGEIQGHIGEIQGKMGEQQGELGERQGELGERMGALGEEMGKIGEQQGKAAEEASRKVRGLIDQAVKDGKAKLVQ